MRERSLRRRFIAYREHGRADDLASVFDEVAPGLRALAGWVLPNSQDADDVLQATFLTAIERRESFDPEQSVRAWLAGILVKRARQHVARESRTIRADDLRSPRAADPVAAASEAELERRLHGALERLPARDRDVLIPLLAGGESPKAIARLQGVKPGTVRVRIHRALARLRKSLPARGASVAVATPRDFEHVRARVLTSSKESWRKPVAGTDGARAATVPATSLSTAPAALGFVVVALFAAGAVAWKSFGFGERDVGAASASTTARQDAQRAPIADGVLVPKADRGPHDRLAVNEAPKPERDATTTERLTIRVSGLGDAPPPGVQLKVHRGGSIVLTTPLASDGVSTIEIPRISRDSHVTLQVAHPAFAEFSHELAEGDRRARGEWHVDVALTRLRAMLRGTVSVDDIRPGDIRVEAGLFPFALEGEGWLGATSKVTTSHEAEFVLWTDSLNGRVVVAADGFVPVAHVFRLEDLGEHDLGVTTLTRGLAIEGNAYPNIEGEPLDQEHGGGVVRAKHADCSAARTVSLGGARVGLLHDRCFNATVDVPVDGDGRFRIAGLERASYYVVHKQRWARAVSSAIDARTAGVRIDAPATGVELVSPIHTYTIVVTVDGRPLRDATVFYGFDGGGSVSGPTDQDGRYDFRMAATDATQHRVVVSKPGFESKEMRLGPRDMGAQRQHEVELARTAAPSNLTFELESPGGPVGPLSIRLELVDSDFYIYRPIDDATDLVEIGEVPAGQYRVSFRADVPLTLNPVELGRWLDTEAEVACRASESEKVRVELKPGGRVKLRVAGLTSTPERAWTLIGPTSRSSLQLLHWDATEGRSTPKWVTTDVDADGEYWIRQALAPGQYLLEVPRATGVPLRESFQLIEGTVAVIDLDL